jgi:predicted ATPase
LQCKAVKCLLKYSSNSEPVLAEQEAIGSGNGTNETPAITLYVVISTVAIQGYRSLREIVLPLSSLSVITGANGSGKSSVYRSLRLLADVAQNAVVANLAREGGLPSTFWAGRETIARSVRQGIHNVEGLAKRHADSLKLGFGSDSYGYSIDLGYPQPLKPQLDTMFKLDPHIKRECI